MKRIHTFTAEAYSVLLYMRASMYMFVCVQQYVDNTAWYSATSKVV